MSSLADFSPEDISPRTFPPADISPEDISPENFQSSPELKKTILESISYK
jgi:hypothetical protein